MFSQASACSQRVCRGVPMGGVSVVCVVCPGEGWCVRGGGVQGVYAEPPPPPRDMVNRRSVRILLECILDFLRSWEELTYTKTLAKE